MKIRSFYDDIFQYHYQKLLDNDSDPEVMPIAIISFSQACHAFLFFVILYFVFELNNSSYIYWASLILYILFLIKNFILYLILDRKKVILSRGKVLSENFGLISSAYLTISMALPFLVMYIFMEFINI